MKKGQHDSFSSDRATQLNAGLASLVDALSGSEKSLYLEFLLSLFGEQQGSGWSCQPLP
jgi:hypothetical protein